MGAFGFVDNQLCRKDVDNQLCRKDVIVRDGSPAIRALQQSCLEMTRAWTRSCAERA